jgi:hypothetical protein
VDVVEWGAEVEPVEEEDQEVVAEEEVADVEAEEEAEWDQMLLLRMVMIL